MSFSCVSCILPPPLTSHASYTHSSHIPPFPFPFPPPLTGHHHHPQASQPASALEMEELRKELDEIARVLGKAPKLLQPSLPPSTSLPPSSSSSATSTTMSGNPDLAHASLEPNNALVPSSTSTVVAAGGGGEGEGELHEQLHAAKSLRHLLSTHREVLIHEVHDKNWIPFLLDWLKLSNCPSIQVEALWALTNIAAGNTEHTNMLLQHNPVPALVALLDSPNEEVLEQAVWVLGNIAGEGAASRDIVLSNHALPPLVHCILTHQQSQQILRIGSWALNNLCDSQPRPALDIHTVMPVLHALLRSEDSEVLSHTCWALSHLCDGPSAHIKVVVEANLCWRLVELLQHRSWRVIKPALRTIGNIVCAEDEVDYTQFILAAGAVPHLKILIGHSNREIQKEACWTLSNIAAGTCEQIQTVLDSGAIPLLVSLALQPAGVTDAEVRSEACWVVLNATSCGSDSQIEFLVREGCIGVLGDLLGEANMVMMALEGLERILQVGEEEGVRMGTANPYACMLSPGKIEELEGHRQAGISKRAGRIWKEHFVTCAICSRTYSKQAPEVRFCGECKCSVCAGCNCMVFHLSYQEELWNEMSVKEASAKEALMASKRNRKQRKKQKEKEKKQAYKGGGGGGATAAAAAGEGGTTGGGLEGGEKNGGRDDGSGSSARNEDDSSSSSEGEEDSPRRAAVPPARQPPPIPPSAAAATAAAAPLKAGGGGGGGGGGKAAKLKATAAAAAAAAGGVGADIGGGGGKRGRGRRLGVEEEEGEEEGGVGLTTTTTTTTSGGGGMLRKAPGAVNGGAKSKPSPASSSSSSSLAGSAPAAAQEEAALLNGGGGGAGGGSKRRGRNRGSAGGEEVVVAPVSVKSETAAAAPPSKATGSGKAVDGAAAGGKGAGAGKKKDAGAAAAKGGGGGDKGEKGGGGGGIDLVDYLQSTGSIIALSKFLDEEDEEDHDDDEGGKNGGLFG